MYVCAHTFGTCLGVLCARATSVGEWCRWGAQIYYKEQQEREGQKTREGGLLIHEWRRRVVGVPRSGAELCREGMQIVSMCGEDRRTELAAGRCG